jgi:hypothetical protein
MTTHRITLNIDCRELAAQHLGAPAARAGRAMQWLCPFHDDRATPSFTVYANGYICFGCGARGNALGLVMALEQVDLPAAAERLGWEGLRPGKRRDPGRALAGWRDAAWQWATWQLVHEAAARLVAKHPGRSPEEHSERAASRRPEAGADWRAREAGRAYLAGRGLEPATWQAWRLGYAPSVRRYRKVGGRWQAEPLGPAITLPWVRGEVVKALQYRLIEHPSLRYWQRAGGERTLFGLDLLAGRPALVAVEGELNAASLWQAIHERADVVSFGPQSNLGQAAPALRRLAARYPFVVAWADEAHVARAALEIMGRGGLALRSPEGRDANDLLRAGLLGELMAAVLS